MILQDLPVLDVLPSLLQALESHPLVILQAPPGAGKSTVLPLKLLDAEWMQGQKMVMLQPRRLAAKSVAARLAHQLDDQLGNTVGYRVRFERKVSEATRIEVLTEGLLSRMIQQDQELAGIGLLIFDEFHERSLHADLALVLALQVQEILRPDLRILIMSATLDAEGLSGIFGNAPVIISQGRQHPIELRYAGPPENHALDSKVLQVLRKALSQDQGDILVFLPGQAEIKRVAKSLEDSTDAQIHPLYGDLSLQEQQAAIQPSRDGRRKVVLATTIAETSLTIEGIKVVIDAGLSRVPRFDPKSGLSRLETQPVTRDAADQRAGRAGRLGPGICYRLWDEAAHQYLQAQRQPEILQADLSSLLLELANWGSIDVKEYRWPSQPPKQSIHLAIELLEDLEAIQEGRITERGRALLRLPTHPRLAHMLEVGKDRGQAPLACDIAALLEERDPLPREAGADICLRLDALRNFRSGERGSRDLGNWRRIAQLSSTWQKIMQCGPQEKMADAYEAGALLLAAYPERLAKRMGNNFKLGNNRRAALAPQDPLMDQEWLAVGPMDAGQQEGRIYLAAPLHPQQLEGFAKEAEEVFWDANLGQVQARLVKIVGPLVLSAKPLQNVPEEKVAQVWCEAIRSHPGLLPWNEDLEQWLCRLASIRIWRDAEGWPVISKEGLLENLEDWLAPYLSKLRKAEELKRLPLMDMVKAKLDWNKQQQLESLAPERIEVPTGSMIKLEYFEDGRPPILAVRLQEMFGLLETPNLNAGRNQVLIHLLSPAYRPCAVTQDLKSFWENAYQDVRKDLRGRYPKHHWPEDPFTAQAVRGTKRNLKP